jgi:hypothetical protein
VDPRPRAHPAPGPAPPPTPSGGDDDGTTRYLCAGAHLDAGFADRAIAEYLVEETRALPPDVGLDVAAVLRDSVDARARRKIRAAVLLVLLVAFLFTLPWLAILWLLTAVAVTVARHGEGSRVTAVMVGASAVVVVLVVVPALGLSGALGSPSGGIFLGSSALFLFLAVVFGLATRGPGGGRVDRRGPDPDPVPVGVRAGRAPAAAWPRAAGPDVGQRAVGTELARFDTASSGPRSDEAEVVVHRNPEPFVGSGTVVRDEVLALPPAGRLGRLSAHETVFVHAGRLLRDRGAPAVDGILPNLSRAPRNSMPTATARRLADRPEEIARLYRCFRVAAWGRDLTTSCFFAVGADEQMLYLEWTHCVLLPIRERFRSIDRPADTSPFWRMLGVLPGGGRRAVRAGRRADGAPGRHRVPGRRGLLRDDGPRRRSRQGRQPPHRRAGR